MKHVKKILSFALALILLVTACYTNGLGVSTGVNAAGETETDVTRVYSGHNATLVTFALSTADYTLATTANPGVGESGDYNFWTEIKVYTGETEYVTLQEAYNANDSGKQKYYNLYGPTNTISIQLGTTKYNDATKIVIPAGTVFPSFAHTNGGSATKGGYVTTQDLEFIKPATISGETTWVKKEDTNVTNIHIRDASGKLLFFLSNQDYSGKGGTIGVNNAKMKEYQFLDKIEVYKSESEHKSLAEL